MKPEPIGLAVLAENDAEARDILIAEAKAYHALMVEAAEAEQRAHDRLRRDVRVEVACQLFIGSIFVAGALRGVVWLVGRLLF